LGAAGRWRLALLLMVASGFSALGYQIVWTQQAALWLGHETAAVLAVVGAFFGGVALGALVLGGRIEGSARPARWYALCEAVIGAWGLALAALLAPAARLMLELTGPEPTSARQWIVAFAGTFLLLLPATAAMGATLPAMERLMARIRAPGRSIAGLYAGNTLGAMAGVLAAALWLVPAFGLLRTAAACALLNVAAAWATWRWLDDAPAAGGARPPRREGGCAAGGTHAAHASTARGLLALLAATGTLGIAYEVLVVRVLVRVTENTVYTFALLLAVYLAGTAAGAAAYQYWRSRRADKAATDAPPWPSSARRTAATLLLALAASVLMGLAALWAAPEVKVALLGSLGLGFVPGLTTEAALAMLAFGAPTFMMGALFSHLATEARRAGIGLGRVIGINTLGAALAPPLAGVLLLPALAPQGALLSISAGYLGLAFAVAPFATAGWALAGATAVIAMAAPPLTLVDTPEGGRLLRHVEGPRAAVSVVEDASGEATLHIDNRQPEGSSATLYADARQALVPLLLHPAPRRALFLGYGSGVTAHAAAQDARVQVTAVELLPEVIEASAHFTRGIADVFGDASSRLDVRAGDARRFVRTSRARFDLIVADNFHPARSGSGALYTVEHFTAVRERLADDGLFVQWLPLHQLDLVTLRSIVRSFAAVWERPTALLATLSLETPVLGLVARADGGRFDLAAVRARLSSVELSQPPAAFGLHDEWALLGSVIAGPAALARFAGDAPLNTDDFPVVSHRAPRATYSPEMQPAERLLALLHAVDVTPDEFVVADAGDRARLAAYLAARNRFLAAGRGVEPHADVRRMLAQVALPLLEVLRASADFRPAYDPLLRMAEALAPLDRHGARALLVELARLQPARDDAALALARLPLAH
jgi:spermidine synthase